jgi:P27 family predicted phage terminase small subunit
VRGRPPKPTGLKLVTGNPGGRSINGAEPEPRLLNDLDPPARLSPASAEVWREVAPMLRRVQVLTELDVLALEMLCDAVADYRQARAERGDKFVVHSAKGSQMVSQWMVAMQMSSKRAEGFMGKFGMDPASRTRLLVKPQGDLFDGDDAGADRFFKR